MNANFVEGMALVGGTIKEVTGVTGITGFTGVTGVTGTIVVTGIVLVIEG